MTPTYLRIADDIAARIDSGSLRPGDKVPSTRQIAREAGVAIATATRVIAELRNRGLVRAVPGVGTIVGAGLPGGRYGISGGSGRSPRAAEDTRAEIVRTAIAVADSEGIAAVSMRRIGVELGMPTMSLYRWVPSKDELTRLMIDSAIDIGPWPDPAPAGWRAQMEYVARRQWRAGQNHPWLARMISLTRPQLAPNAMKMTDWCMGALLDAGLGLLEALEVSVAMTGHVQGLAMNIENERQSAMDSGITSDEWMDTQAQLADQILRSGEFPALGRLVAMPDVDYRLDDVFEIGLRLFLDGLAQRLADAGR